jgi:hypothetical protein
VSGRFFQRLEQGIGGGLIEPVGRVDQGDLEGSAARGQGFAPGELSYRVDGDLARLAIKSGWLPAASSRQSAQ